MERLREFDSLTIREKKEYAGIPATWKMRPEFCVVDPSDEERFYIVSEKGALGFALLKASKSFTLYMVDRKGDEVLYFEKQVSFLSEKLSVFNSDEEVLGSVMKKKTKSPGKAVFEIFDQTDRVLYEVEGPAVDPETFQIRQNDTTVGKLSKRWGKTLEEGVSKQAHFGIVFPMGCDTKEKSLLLGALFLIDLFY